jgi:hypothetical protein
MGKQIHVDHDFQGGAKITGLPQSTAAGQPVVHEQLTSALEAIAWKANVRVSTQGNINLASPGASINGISMNAGERFLARLQTSASENGIYVWNGASTTATRAPDASTFTELEKATVTVEEGADAGVSYRQTQVNGTLGSTDILWVTFGTAAGAASEGAAGIAEIATQAETDGGTDDARIITPLKLKTSPHAKRKAIATLGDGSGTQFDITHNFGTKDVIAQLRLASDDAVIEAAIRNLDANTTRINFATAPASNAIKATLLA